MSILVILLFVKVESFLQKKEVIVQKITQVSSDPLQMKLNSDNFMFAVSI